MENKERYHNATSIAPLVGLEPTTLGCWQPMLYQLSYQGKNVRVVTAYRLLSQQGECKLMQRSRCEPMAIAVTPSLPFPHL